MYLVNPRAEPRMNFPVYPESVWRALVSIRAATRAAYSEEDEKLDAGERLLLADGVQFLGLTKLFDSHLDEIERRMNR